MSTCTTVNEWRLARESAEWVGPIVCTLTRLDGTVVPMTSVQFAVLLKGVRAVIADFANPYLNPDGTGEFGVFVAAVSTPAVYGIWAKTANSLETDWLEPDQVGYIRRT